MVPTPATPLVVVGGGPIGLAAAAHAVERGLPVVVLEAGDDVGAAVTGWSHVRLFSPWSELVDPAAGRLLDAAGWAAPDPAGLPSGADWVADYLRPLATALERAGVDVRRGHRVVGLARSGRDRLVADGRADVPFAVHVQGPSGHRVLAAAAVVDASGTWGGPGPLGADGYPAPGEQEHGDRVLRAIPDLADTARRARHAGRHTVVAGAGASAQNALVALAGLAEDTAGTRVTWVVRCGDTAKALGGAELDELAARGALGRNARRAADAAAVTTVTGFRTAALEGAPDGSLVLVGHDGRRVEQVDEVVAVTGFRPDRS